MAIKLFNTPSYNFFNYQPRYYDPKKEKRENRRRSLKLENGKDVDLESKPGDTIKGSFTYRINRKTTRNKASTIRFLIILVILSFVAYLILIADLTPLVAFFTS